MSVLDAFFQTWEKARDNFGQDTPQGGVEFDASANLQNLGAYVRAAAPGAAWTGDASESYEAANAKHGDTFDRLASLDMRMAYYLDQSAQTVVQGRRDLESVRSWVASMALQIPPTQDGDLMRMAIASDGLHKISEIVERSNSDLQEIAENMRGDISKYSDIAAGNAAATESLPEYVGDLLPEDVDGTPGALTSDEGRADGQSLDDGMLSPLQRERLLEAGNLEPGQFDALAAGGTVNVGADRMAYLYQLSQSMNGMAPEKIKAISQALPPDERTALAQGLALISNPNAQSGVPNTEGVTDDTRDSFVPSAGSLSNLPDTLYQELTRGDRVESGPLLNAPGAMQPDTVNLSGVGAMQDIAKVFEPAVGGYLNGNEATGAMLAAVSQYANADIHHQNEIAGGFPNHVLNSDHHTYDGYVVGDTGVSNALADVLQVAGNDHLGFHSMATGSGKEDFLTAITHEQWGDRSHDVGNILRWIDDDPSSRVHGETASSLAHHLAATAPVLDGGLATGAAEALSPYLSQLAGVGGPDNGVERFGNSGAGDLAGMSDMFSALNHDHDAASLINGAASRQYEDILTDNAARGADNWSEHELRTAGRLSEAMQLSAKETNLYERETAQWQEALAHGKQEDFVNNFITAAGIVPQFSQASAIGEIAANLLGGDPTNPATVQGGGEMMRTLIEGGGATTNPVDYKAVVLDGLIRAYPEIAQDPQLALIVSDGQIDMDKVDVAARSGEHKIDEWFRTSGRSYDFDDRTISHWLSVDAQGRGQWTDWSK